MTPADFEMGGSEAESGRIERRPGPDLAADAGKRRSAARFRAVLLEGHATFPLVAAHSRGGRGVASIGVEHQSGHTILRGEGLRGCLNGGAAAGSAERGASWNSRIYRAVEGIRPIGSRLGVAQRPSAPDAGASAQNPPRR